jgi:hypothetical protein
LAKSTSARFFISATSENSGLFKPIFTRGWLRDAKKILPLHPAFAVLPFADYQALGIHESQLDF